MAGDRIPAVEHQGQTLPTEAKEPVDLDSDLGGTVLTPSYLAELLDQGRLDREKLEGSIRIEAAAPLQIDPRDHCEKEMLFRNQAFHEVGNWLRISGLESEAGQKLNGRLGRVVAAAAAATAANNNNTKGGRLAVEVAGEKKLLRPECLQPLADNERLHLVRLFCRGDRENGARSEIWPLKLVIDRPSEVCSFSSRVGVRIHVTRIESDRELNKDEDFENPWLSHLMIDAQTGATPLPWHRRPGAALAWREDGGILETKDICLLLCFIDKLLPRYRSEEDPVDVEKEVTQEAFEFFRMDEMRAAEGDEQERGVWWGDHGFNI